MSAAPRPVPGSMRRCSRKPLSGLGAACRASHDEFGRQADMRMHQWLLADQLAHHPPARFRDFGTGLCNHADPGIEQCESLEIVHDEQPDILRNAKAEALNRWDDS